MQTSSKKRELSLHGRRRGEKEAFREMELVLTVENSCQERRKRGKIKELRFVSCDKFISLDRE